MKRNLFAIFLALIVITALVMIVAPGTKAVGDDTKIYRATANDTIELNAIGGKILDLNGHNVEVHIPEGKTLSVIDTSFMTAGEDGGYDLTGTKAGKLTKTGDGEIATVTFDADENNNGANAYRYLKVENDDGTYSFHPFNLTVSRVGINTGNQKYGTVICIRTTFIANDVVKALFNNDAKIENGKYKGQYMFDYGLKRVSGATPVSVSGKAAFPFGDFNGVHAFFDVGNSLGSDETLDTPGQYRAYMMINGEEIVSNEAPIVVPRDILKLVNNQLNDRVAAGNDGLTASQRGKLLEAAEKTHLHDLFTGLTNTEKENLQSLCNHTAKAIDCNGAVSCKNCDKAEGEGFEATDPNLITGHEDENGDGFCDECLASDMDIVIEGKNNFINMTQVSLPGSSKTWEISGKLVRPAYDTDGWNFGFEVSTADGKQLSFTATTNGIVFESNGTHSRYPYHAFAKTQYNLDTTFISAISKKDNPANNNNGTPDDNTDDTTEIYFKAVIVDDMFYCFFGEEEADLKLTWVIPLTEVLGSADTYDANNKVHTPTWDEFTTEDLDTEPRLFPGFSVGSNYSVRLRVNRTSGSGSILNLKVKTNAVNADVIPELKYIANDVKGFEYDSMDYEKGILVSQTRDDDVASNGSTAGYDGKNPGDLNKLSFVGNSKTWGILGTIDKEGADPLNFGFEISDGAQTLSTQHSFDELVKTFNAPVRFRATIVDNTLKVYFWSVGQELTSTEPALNVDLTNETAVKTVFGESAVPFTADSSYKVSFVTSNNASIAKLSDLTVTTAPRFTTTANNYFTVDNMTGTVTSVNGQINEFTIDDTSKTWEISGTAERLAELTANDWCMGFMIQAGGKSLRFSATRLGMVFESNDPSHTRYPYHAFQTSQYTWKTNSGDFAFYEAPSDNNHNGHPRTQSKMHFKAMIANDVFYAWFWYEGEEAPAADDPSWVIPLTEVLSGTGRNEQANWSAFNDNNKTPNPFCGFADNSNYQVSLFVNGTSTVGQFTNLTVKTGEDVAVPATLPAPKTITDNTYKWTYTYDNMTATRTNGQDGIETETATRKIVVYSGTDGKYYSIPVFEREAFNKNLTEGWKEVNSSENAGFAYGKTGLNTYLFNTDASKYYYAQMTIGASTNSGWVGFIHSADDANYFFDAVSYKAGANYEHSFGSVIAGKNPYVNIESASSFEGINEDGSNQTSALTGANFGESGMTLTTIRSNDKIYLFINGKRVATYLIDEDLANANTIPGLYFDDNGESAYNGTLTGIEVVTDQTTVKAKLNDLLDESAEFNYANNQNWNKNDGIHTDAEFNADGSFTYTFDESVRIHETPEGGNNTYDRRFVTGVTDRVFLSGNYYYEYKISGKMEGHNDNTLKTYGLFFNWVNSAQSHNGYYRHEAMLAIKENDGLQYVHFDAGKGSNGDGVSGWTGGTAFGGTNDLLSINEWQSLYKQGLIVRIERVSYKAGVCTNYRMSVTSEANPNLQILSKIITVYNWDKADIYGNFDWILFGTQSVDCTVSNVTFGRLNSTNP